jgi:hypothetical protein
MLLLALLLCSIYRWLISGRRVKSQLSSCDPVLAGLGVLVLAGV